jgi:hypothetical protein
MDLKEIIAYLKPADIKATRKVASPEVKECFRLCEAIQSNM